MSQKNEIKKAEEKSHFEMFQRLFTEFPLPNAYIQNEHPDFLVISSCARLGIEHTKVLKDETFKDPFMNASKFGDQKKILKKASTICVTKKLEPLWVQVSFSSSNLQYSREDIDRISRGLADLVVGTCSENQLEEKIVLNKNDFSDNLPEVRRIDIRKGIVAGNQWLSNHRWQVVSAAWVRCEFSKEIQKRLDEKNPFYQSYRQRCDSCWLLIVADRSIPYQCFQIDKNTEQYIYSSSFDRTFFLEVTHEKLVELICHK